MTLSAWRAYQDAQRYSDAAVERRRQLFNRDGRTRTGDWYFKRGGRWWVRDRHGDVVRTGAVGRTKAPA